MTNHILASNQKLPNYVSYALICGISRAFVLSSGTAFHSYLQTVKERQPYVADLAR
jgi:hypothetical protein